MIAKSKVLVGAVLLVILTSLTTYTLTLRTLPVEPGEIAKLSQLLNLVEQRFVDPDRVGRQQLLEGAAAGILEALEDPYTSYMTAEEHREFMVRTSGTFSGVGMTIGVRDQFVTVIAPLRGTPAERAGIRPGDRILRVDGVDVVNRTSAQVAVMIRGPEGTSVTLTLVRPPDPTPFELKITRASIQVPAADRRMLEPGIGYLQIFTFNEHATREVSTFLQELRGQGARALVLDLRNNAGGHLHVAIDTTGFFVPPGPVVTIAGRERRQTFQSDTPGLGMPLVVLVNQWTASASEIMAGAIQDRRVGTIMGTKTFGKGSVQNIISLPDGSAVRLTTERYYTPDGDSIEGVGITPDVVVEAAAPTPALRYQRTLGAGVMDLMVREVQERLLRLGHRVTADGVMSPAMVEVLRSFQRQRGLPVTGNIDQATVETLNRVIAELDVAYDPQLQRAVSELRAILGR